MKTKTIKKIIINKLNAWISTIEDKQLAKDLKPNILVSGGSIASMLLREDVNDYDVYIKDMDVLVRLANYYCPSRVLDGRKKEEYLLKWEHLLKEDGTYETTEGELLASVDFVRVKTLKADQVKLDINSSGERHQSKEGEAVTPYSVAFFSQNAISLTDDVQIVLRFSGDSEQIHKTFDFIHATNYFTFEEGLVLNQRALESLLTKELVYQGSLYPLTSIIRMKKFILRHWQINAGEILKIMFQISELDLKNIETLEEQLIGVDVAYFSTLIEVLRGTDSQDLTSKYINEQIDRVFNQHFESEDAEDNQ